MKYRIVQICVNEDLKHILKGLTKGIAPENNYSGFPIGNSYKPGMQSVQ